MPTANRASTTNYSLHMLPSLFALRRAAAAAAPCSAAAAAAAGAGLLLLLPPRRRLAPQLRALELHERAGDLEQVDDQRRKQRQQQRRGDDRREKGAARVKVGLRRKGAPVRRGKRVEALAASDDGGCFVEGRTGGRLGGRLSGGSENALSSMIVHERHTASPAHNNAASHIAGAMPSRSIHSTRPRLPPFTGRTAKAKDAGQITGAPPHHENRDE